MSNLADEPTAAPSPPFDKPDTAHDPAPHHPTGQGDVSATLPIAKRTRVGTAWVGAVLAALLLVLLLVFILQNMSRVRVDFLWLSGQLPLGIALLFAAVGGVLIMAAIAGARVVQLRRAAHRVEKAAR